MRLLLLTSFITFLSLYAWKDWYKSLCGLIVLMAVLERPDMPKTMLDIPGLNPWNILLMFVLMGWFIQKNNEKLVWDMPRVINILLFMYVLVVVVSFIRMLGYEDMLIQQALEYGRRVPTTIGLWSDFIINNVKYMIPGLLLFLGCRDKTRLYWGIAAILVMYFVLGLQVIKWMPISEISSGDVLKSRALRILDREIGYHRVDLSMILAGASWAFFSIRVLAKSKALFYVFVFTGFIMLLAQGLTGGRMGYVTWGVVGFVLCFFRWRKYLLLSPMFVILVLIFVPAISERMTEGFSEGTGKSNELIADELVYEEGEIHWYTVTAGRVLAWPYVIEKILDAPIIGYGRQAMQTQGISQFIWDVFRDKFPHPHNAYLELMLDNGLIGFLPIILFYILIIKYSMSLFRDSRSPIFIAVGGLAFSLVAANLIASMGSQSFYPRPGVVGMWCGIGLMLRVYVERIRMVSAAASKEQLDKQLINFWK